MKKFEIKLENVTISKNSRLIVVDEESGTETIVDLNDAKNLQAEQQKEQEFIRIYKKLKKNKSI